MIKELTHKYHKQSKRMKFVNHWIKNKKYKQKMLLSGAF